MHFYSMNYAGVLELPLHTFWEMSRNVDRIRAEEDMRMIAVIGQAFSEKEDYFNRLQADRGEIATSDKPYVDRSGLDNLKFMMGGGNGSQQVICISNP